MKRFLTIVMTLCFLAAAVSFGSFAAGEAMGDADQNGVVDIQDALFVMQAANGKQALTEAQSVLADVTYDGTVDTVDALRILLYVNGDVNDLDRLGGEEGDLIHQGG